MYIYNNYHDYRVCLTVYANVHTCTCLNECMYIVHTKCTCMYAFTLPLQNRLSLGTIPKLICCCSTSCLVLGLFAFWSPKITKNTCICTTCTCTAYMHTCTCRSTCSNNIVPHSTEPMHAVKAHAHQASASERYDWTFSVREFSQPVGTCHNVPDICPNTEWE